MVNYIDATFEEIKNGDFKLYNGNPIIKCFGISPVIADPSLITKENSHDGKLHLFAHALLGVYSFSSDDGVNWKKEGRVVANAMRPDCNYINGKYYLYYEQTESLFKKALSFLGGKWKSKIYLITSKDLKTWSEPKLIIDADRGYMSDDKGTSISNPFLTEIDGKYRLYFSAGLTFIKDCGFSEPTHISYAESDSLEGGFVTREAPIISPDNDSKYLNLCSGCMKVYKLKDCYIGLQNGIYKDGNKSHSTIMLLKSEDGVKFEFEKVFLEPTQTDDRIKNWMAQYVYACNLIKHDGELYLYFNARNVSNNIQGREHIGVYTTKK